MNYYEEIKVQIINNEITKRAKDYSKNKSDLNTYYNVGKILSEAGKHYGEGIIKEYSIKLTKEFGKGYTATRLRYFRRFFEVFSKCPTLSDILTYSHYCELIWFNDINKINYYIKISVDQNLSVRELRSRIKAQEYERLDDKTKVNYFIKKSAYSALSSISFASSMISASSINFSSKASDASSSIISFSSSKVKSLYCL